MKTTFKPALILMAILCSLSCAGGGSSGSSDNEGNGGGGGGIADGIASLLEQDKTVRAYSPNMVDVEMLSMTQKPGWSLLAGTQWIGNTYCNSVMGVNDKLGGYFSMDGPRAYTHDDYSYPNGLTVYLKFMSAADYMDYVFRRQFPGVKDAQRTRLMTIDQFSEAEQRQLEEQRQVSYNSSVQYSRQLPNAANFRIKDQTIDRSYAEYKWVQNGDTIVHAMDVVINATHQEFVSPYFQSSMVLWTQQLMLTYTGPVKHIVKVKEAVEQMLGSVKYNSQYLTALNNIVAEGMQRHSAETQRIMNEMAISELKHQQNMARQIQETQEYVMNTRREVFANRQASMERVNQGWTDVIRGVNRYTDGEGKVMEVPVSAGSNVWHSAEGGTIYSSDSYLFNSTANLPDKDGIVREFRQLQLLK